jgi:ubiquinone/menaquinone biosynthesis C-methylase UbiE
MGEPSVTEARARYSHIAARYDELARPSARWRRMAVQRFALVLGETVFDVAGGTGVNLAGAGAHPRDTRDWSSASMAEPEVRAVALVRA